MSKQTKNKIKALEEALGNLIQRVALLECPNRFPIRTNKVFVSANPDGCGTCVVCECKAMVNDATQEPH